MKVTTVGVDLAKNVIQVHGVDERGKAVLKKQLKRDQVGSFFGNLPACLVGMEACGSAHHWARKLQSLGHTVKLMAPQFVKPYVKTNKNDVADAEAICEAVARPNMRFVPIKTAEQQSVLSLHRARQGFVKARTAQGNQIRGLLSEYGIVMPQGIGHIAKRLPEILEDGQSELPGQFRALLWRLGENFKEMDRQVRELEREIKTWHRENEASRKLEKIPGIGALTASALAASVGNASCFADGPDGRLARPGPQAALHRRQTNAAGHQQARGHLSADVAHPWCSSRGPGQRAQARARYAAQTSDGQAQQECRGGGVGEQECTHRLGAVEA